MLENKQKWILFCVIETPSWYDWNTHNKEEEYGAESLIGLIARTSVWTRKNIAKGTTDPGVDCFDQ